MVRFSGVFWLALILVALAGQLAVRHLPEWMIALGIVAGVALGNGARIPAHLVSGQLGSNRGSGFEEADEKELPSLEA